MDQPSVDADLTANSTYQSPSLICDVVMKGGITSGVTYPQAVCEVARTYRLRNIGGTSAGAIAAAAAAAAEVGRASARGGFVRLATLPQRLSLPAVGQKDSVMFNLFQPSKRTRPLFAVLTAVLKGKGSRVRQGWNVLRALVSGAPVAAVLGAAFGLITTILLIVANRTQPGLRSSAVAIAAVVLGAVAGIVLAIIGGVAAAGAILARRALRELPANRFGMCSGFTPGDPSPPGTPGGDDLQVSQGRLGPKPLTTWLADEFDAMAGKIEGEPLALGDLAARGVNLRMFTTNLTEGAPYTLPFRDRTFFFSPAEFGDLFPARVVASMVANVPTPRDEREAEMFDRMGKHDPQLLPLPDPEHFPVVVMTRLSLSFPFLLSAVPLWAGRRSRNGQGVEVRRSWFSDGGISSNFPIHFFDAPLPRWPTFGINLGPAEKLDPTDERRNIWAPRSNLGGIRPRWGDLDSLSDFVHAIADTMQNWLDNSQMRVPGYRDRVVTILHSREEGGMNLNMEQELIERFSERGRRAGQFLVNRFSHAQSTNPDDRLSWENHRWLRYRTLMPLVEDLATRLVIGYEWVPDVPSSRPYGDLITGSLKDVPSYPWCDADQRATAQELTQRLVSLGRLWGRIPDPVPPDLPSPDVSAPPLRERWDPSRPLACGAPKPRPSIRIVQDL